MFNLEAARLFQQLTGISAAKALNALSPTFCQPHRLSINACKPCREGRPAKAMCDDHVAQFTACAKCERGENTADPVIIYGLAFLRQRETEPGADWEEFTRDTPFATAMLLAGEFAAGANRTPSSSDGSRPSSRPTRGSRRERSGV